MLVANWTYAWHWGSSTGSNSTCNVGKRPLTGLCYDNVTGTFWLARGQGWISAPRVSAFTWFHKHLRPCKYLRYLERCLCVYSLQVLSQVLRKCFFLDAIDCLIAGINNHTHCVYLEIEIIGVRSDSSREWKCCWGDHSRDCNQKSQSIVRTLLCLDEKYVIPFVSMIAGIFLSSGISRWTMIALDKTAR